MPALCDKPPELVDTNRYSDMEDITLVDELDWDALKTLDAHSQQQDPSRTCHDNGFLLQRIEHDNARYGKRASTTSHKSKRASVQQVRRSLVETVSRSQTPEVTKPQYTHARNESKEILLTDLELWTALVSDYAQTAIRLPTLTTRKIRAGVPQPLRGLVWQAMSGARDTHLEGLYDSLCAEKNTPFEKVIGRDLMRTFPQVEMFQQEGGEGQCDLGKVLRAFSLYDAEVGYCQGLAFIAAPLLMNMAHQEAFCVLVRIMEGYGMRSMFTSTLSGLKIRLYQFEQLFEQHLPDLAAYLKILEVLPGMYASQWFLSIFAVTCPLATLHRIYDLFLAEGAPETIMRLALTLLAKHKDALMTLDIEGVMQVLLTSDLWTIYDGDDDMLINETVSLSNIITNDILLELELQFEHVNHARPSPEAKGLQSVAASFLTRINPGRLFSTSFSPTQFDIDNPLTRAMSKISTHSAASSILSKLEIEPVDESSNSSFSRNSSQSLRKHTQNLGRQNKQLNLQVEEMISALNEAHKDIASLKQDKEAFSGCLDEYKVISRELLDAISLPDDATRQVMLSHWTTELHRRLADDPLSSHGHLSAEKILFLESELDSRNAEVDRMRSTTNSMKSAIDTLTRERTRLEKLLQDQQRRPRNDEIDALRMELSQSKASLAIAHAETEDLKFKLRRPSDSAWFWKRN